ncbi:MAG: hypothetical protein AB7F22_07800 [Reyranella sp.]|uniref:hypothetical protein n=1 Tax=Reyranella sp. TaxID=1929291 RepID=UPI003D0D11C1
MNEHLNQVRAGIDAAAAAGIVAALVGWLPAIAAALGIVWYLIQIAESKTGRAAIQWVRSRISKR